MDERSKKAKPYSSTKHSLVIADILATLVFFIIIEISGFSGYLSTVFSNLSSNIYLARLLYIAALGFLLGIATFPIDLVSSFVVEHIFKLSNQCISSWFRDYIKKSMIGLFLFILVIFILYYFLTISPLWWLFVPIVYFLINILFSKIFPVIVIPLFFKLKRIEDTSLAQQLMALANKAGVKVLDIYNIALSEKTKKANAALCGLGSTKRILISDTLINDYTSDEIETTIGHEIAHYKYRHFWKLSFYNLLFTLIGLGLAAVLLQQMVSFGYIKEAYNIKSLPVLAILYILYSVIITPVMNRISCYYEKEADLAAIGLTNKPQAFIGLINKLTLQNLSDPQPALLIELFFYDHPPAKKRVKIAHLLEK